MYVAYHVITTKSFCVWLFATWNRDAGMVGEKTMESEMKGMGKNMGE
jgi:hypothetical protein